MTEKTMDHADTCTLSSLLERVEKAPGDPDRELDAEIDITMFGGETIWKQANYTMEMYPASRRPSKHHVGGFAHEHVPHFTSSIDAALALVNEKLPDREVAIGDDRENSRWWALVDDDCWDEAMERFEGYGKTAPIALLSALLRALIAQQESKQ